MRLKGSSLSDERTIARFCRAASFSDGKLQPTAFLLREKQQREEYLSVNCLEILHQNKLTALGKFKSLISKKLSVKPNSGAAILNVGSLVNNAEIQRIAKLSVLNGLNNNEPSYSGIFGYPMDQDLIAELILEVVQETIRY